MGYTQNNTGDTQRETQVMEYWTDECQCINKYRNINPNRDYWVRTGIEGA